MKNRGRSSFGRNLCGVFQSQDGTVVSKNTVQLVISRIVGIVLSNVAALLRSGGKPEV